MTRRVKGRALALLLAGMTLWACGGKDPGSLSARARSQLQAETARVREAASSRDRSGAETALARFRTSVSRLQGEGELTDEQSRRLLALAARVESELALVPLPAASPPTTQPTSEPRQQRGKDEEDEGKGKGKEKGDD